MEYNAATLRDLRRQVAHDRQLASVTASRATDGAADGMRLIEVRTIGGFGATILPDRGGDVFDLRFAGQPLGWTGPAGLSALSRSSADQEGGLGLLRGFSGALVTCGYDYFGAAREDAAAHLGYALRERQHYPLHGRASFLSADLRRSDVVWDGDAPHEAPHVVVEMEIVQAALFGEAFHVRRRLAFDIGRASLTITDTVESRARVPVPHQVLYHINLGFPLIGGGTRIDGLPADAGMPSPIPTIEAPGQEAFRFLPIEDCAETVTVTNADGLSLRIEPLTDTFRHIGQWWNAYPGMTCVGIEPASADMPPGPDTSWTPETHLAPGETATYALRLTARGDG